ncbi:hypothetical protein EVAR_41675_1 [Eumeta japonica]|uniref:Uncharacterized protein n=1 Tax=Eumeta variegata TaxID=151549 RepID=A0A4C1VS09_EUMVA|nr:hypothetical protein EVAR_41675_1 [Eumeta japonica]
MAATPDADNEILEHSSYLSDLFPSHFYLLPRFKEYLKRQRFKDDVTVAAAVQEFLGPLHRSADFRDGRLKTHFEVAFTRPASCCYSGAILIALALPLRSVPRVVAIVPPWLLVECARARPPRFRAVLRPLATVIAVGGHFRPVCRRY